MIHGNQQMSILLNISWFLAVMAHNEFSDSANSSDTLKLNIANALMQGLGTILFRPDCEDSLMVHTLLALESTFKVHPDSENSRHVLQRICDNLKIILNKKDLDDGECNDSLVP